MEDNKILRMSLDDIMGDRFGRYSKYIIQDRALPDVRDGLKPVQRRILYAMFKEGNLPTKAYRKSAKTVGNVIGNYHPHGDSSVYDAMVRLSQDWKMRIPLVDMQGNNGSIDNDPAAAMRYTEARLAPISMELLKDLDKYKERLAPYFAEEIKDEPSYDDILLQSAYDTLRKAAKEKDDRMIGMTLNELAEFDIPKKHLDRVSRIKECFERQDYDGIKKECNEE